MASTTIISHAIQPDISYHPDKQKYLLRKEQVEAGLPSNTKLPPQFAEQLTGPLVWSGEDFTNEREWTFVLSEPHFKEIHEALLHFKCE